MSRTQENVRLRDRFLVHRAVRPADGTEELSSSVRIRPLLCSPINSERYVMSLGTILIIILILVLLGVIPTWPHSSGWGYGPSGLVGTILVILLILVLLGRI